MMSHKLIIAAVGAAILMAAGASPASAEINFGINLYSSGGYPTYVPEPAYPYYDGYDDYDTADCGYEYITVRKWNRYHTGYRIVHRRVWVCN